MKDAGGLLKGLAQHLAVYDLSRINEDLLKDLYQHLVDPETRHDLGEFYTPDWLAELTLREARWGKGKSLLDPACGSGTFLFLAIRLLREQGLNGAALVDKATEDIVGTDVHPLAVTIAKINYLLALTPDLAGYKQKLTIPIYMADSLVIREKLSFGEESLSVTVPGGEKFGIPSGMTVSPDKLDSVIDEMRVYAGKPAEEAAAGFQAYLKRQGYEKWNWIWLQNLRLMMKLVKEGRDTIWSFILKNYYRPTFFCQQSFSLVAGNPPWLSYRYIRDPDYQKQVKELVMQYNLLDSKDTKLFTHMDISTLFFAYSLFNYVRSGETIAFVMPRSIITGAKHHAKFRDIITGKKSDSIWHARLRKLIDLEKVIVAKTPTKGIFNVPACVLIARKGEEKDRSIQRLDVEGTLSKRNLGWQEAQANLTIERSRMSPEVLFPSGAHESYYLDWVKSGGNIYPRCFWFVQPAAGKGLGVVDRNKPYVQTDSDVEKDAKEPWKGIELVGEVEANFIYTTLLSKSLLPFDYMKLYSIVLPLEISEMGMRMLNSRSALREGYSGLSRWLSKVENLWETTKKKNVKEDVYRWLDYRGKLTSQYSETQRHCVVYGMGGTNLVSCVIESGRVRASGAGEFATGAFWSDVTTYYFHTHNGEEAHFLCAFLNSRYINEAIKPHQTRGAWGARHIHRRPFEFVPIPKFDATDERHLRLAELSQKCHKKVPNLKLAGKSIGFLRNKVREALKAELEEIDKLVRDILTAA